MKILAPLDLTEATPGSWSGSVPAADGEYYASLTVEDDLGRTDFAASYFVVENGRAHVPAAIHQRAAWIADAVVHGVVPRNFNLRGSTGSRRGWTA